MKLKWWPWPDLPDVPEAQIARLRVAAVELRVKHGLSMDAALLVGEFLGVDEATARTVLRYWKTRTRAQKLALFGWGDNRRCRSADSPIVDHPMRDDQLDGIAG